VDSVSPHPKKTKKKRITIKSMKNKGIKSECKRLEVPWIEDRPVTGEENGSTRKEKGGQDEAVIDKQLNAIGPVEASIQRPREPSIPAP
jgi:hypothetical protein